MPETTATYRESLTPSPWIYLSTALVMPASLLVFLPISIPAGIAIALALYGSIVVVLLATTPRVDILGDELRAGRARLPVRFIAEAEAIRGPEAIAARGVDLDARAWMLLRGWIPDLVKIELDDPNDPTPYWLISTRRPDELVAAITAARAV